MSALLKRMLKVTPSTMYLIRGYKHKHFVNWSIRQTPSRHNLVHVAIGRAGRRLLNMRVITKPIE